MDKEIVTILKSYGISDIEIENIKNIAPMIEVTTCDEFAMNCWLLVNYGYPDSELDYLFMANPNIFVKSSNDLKEELEDLSRKYDDIETILKEDPTII